MNDAESGVSVLFAEVCGSARMHEKLPDAEALRAVDRCLRRMERSIEAFSGRVVKIASGELMAVFNSADEAYQAGIEMLQRVDDLPPVSGVKLEIRVGFSFGSVGEEDGVVTGATVSAAACLAGLAKPGQVLTDLETRSALSSTLARSTRDLGVAAPSGKSAGEVHLFEAIAPDLSLTAARLADIAEGNKTEGLYAGRFRLRHASETIIVDDNRPLVRMGRDNDSDLQINDRRASRHHALIEHRGSKVVLVDTSTNGTFVTVSGQPELFLRKGECVLRGKGVICFAASSSSQKGDFIEFEQL